VDQDEDEDSPNYSADNLLNSPLEVYIS
jgi:hypothetical protein